MRMVSCCFCASSDYKDVFYKFSLQLVDVESGLAEWMDEKEIRKTTER